MSIENKGLCFRCECRAVFLETGKKTQLECGMSVEGTVYGCSEYQPVKPLVVEKEIDKERTQFTGDDVLIRSLYVEDADCCQLIEQTVHNGVIEYWIPKQNYKEI